MAFYQQLLKKRTLQKLAPYFFIGTALLILVFNDVFGDEDGYVVFSLLFFTGAAIWMSWWLIVQIKSILRLKKEKKQVELLHLKSQVNPHSFFNLLNMLYGLVDQDPAKAQQVILKLSDLMRYSIYEGQNEWVALSDEISYLENYMELHRMRYHKQIEIRFEVDVEDSTIPITPLLFIILVENAFKHGVEKLRKDAFVHIRLKASRKQIDFSIENNFDTEQLSEKEGIGLKNLKKRLDLVYPNRHVFEIYPVQADIYKIRLSVSI